VDKVIFIHDGFIAFTARLGPGLTGCEVSCEGGDGDIQLAVLAKFRLVLASFFMFLKVRLGELFRAVWALIFSVKLFLMLLFEVDVEQLMAGGAFLDVSSAVAEVCCYL
jgi:hypothetical protein